jgi:WD40 repeat protein
VLRIAWRPDDAIVASGSADHMVRLWDVRRGRPLAVLGGHADWVHDVTWSPDGGTLASCAGAQDGTVRFWQPT